MSDGGLERFDPWKRHRARRLALQALYQHQVSASSAAELEAQFADELDPERVETDYFSALVRGITASSERLNEHLEPVVDRGVKRLDPVERAALWIGVYELEHRIDVPFRVVIQEAISLVKLFGTETSHRMVNGVLDKLATRLRQVEKAALRGSAGAAPGAGE